MCGLSATMRRVASMPFDARHVDVHDHDVGLNARGELRSPPRRCSPPRRPPRPGSGAQRHDQPFAEHRVVVGEQHPDRLPRGQSPRTVGTGCARARRCRGLARRHASSTVPPNSAARSRMDDVPTPGRQPGAKPRPSSCTTACSMPSALRCSRTSQRVGTGMPHDVGHRLVHDPVGRDLDRGGQPEQVVRGAHRDVGRVAGALETRTALAQRRDQPQLVERRRAQPVDEAAHVVDGLPDVVASPSPADRAARLRPASRPARARCRA